MLFRISATRFKPLASTSR